MLMKSLPAFVLALFAVTAHGQSLTKPKEFYFDQDNAARPIVVVEGDVSTVTEQLAKERERGRKAVEATAQLARIAIQQNRIDLGKALYAQAMEARSGNTGLGRGIRWNYGWDLYRLGEYDAALEQWASLISAPGGPSWIPPTLALALWRVDRKPEALQWYAAAVRTEPYLWNDPANFPQLLPDWSDGERTTLAEVHAAWQADPPSWP